MLSPAVHASLSQLAYPSAVGAVSDSDWSVLAPRAVANLGFDAETHCEDDNEVLAAWNDEHLVFAFRGTTTGFDWLADSAYLSPWGIMPRVGVSYGLPAHWGYVRSLQTVWPWIRSVWEHHSTKQIHWTGHSKGGGIASLAAARSLAAGRPVASCYTFGEPPNTSRHLARLMKNARFDRRRYVRCQDPVPRLFRIPRLLGCLNHWGDVYYFDRHDELRINHSSIWMLWDRTTSRILNGFSLQHDVNGYRLLVEQHEKQARHARDRRAQSARDRQSAGRPRVRD